MREDRGLPEASLDDGGTAEFSGFIQPVQHLHGRLPVNTCIGDTDTILESGRAIFGDVLPAGINVGFNHNTGDGAVASDQLLADGVNNLWLVVVVFEGVPVGTVNHDARLVLRTRLLESSRGGLDMFGVIVGTLGTTSEDDVDVLVAGGLDDCGKALLGNAHESVRVGRGFHGVHCNTDASIGSVLKANREGDTGGELTVELGLSSASTNSTPRDEVSDVLRGDGVEKFRPNRDSKAGKVAQELPSKTKALVDLEGAIEVWIIDETFPPDGCAWLFEVCPHDDEEVAPFGDLGFEKLGIGDGLLGRMDRAGANDNENPIIVACQNSSSSVAGRSDGLLGDRGGNDLMAEESRLNEWVVSDNTTILNVTLKLSCAAWDRSDTTGSVNRSHVFVGWKPPTTVHIYIHFDPFPRIEISEISCRYSG